MKLCCGSSTGFLSTTSAARCTPTGTNLLGLVKHLAGVEFWYFGDAFGRPPSNPRPWSEEDVRNNADMWATAGESRDQIDGMYLSLGALG